MLTVAVRYCFMFPVHVLYVLGTSADTRVDILWTSRLLHCTHCAEKLDMHSAYNVDAVELRHFSVA